MIQLLLKALVRVVSWLPLELARALGRGVGTVFYWLDGDAARITRINLKRCYPERSVEVTESLVLASLKHTGMLALEVGVLWYWPEHKWQGLIRRAVGMELMNDEKGVFLLVPHYGSWEFISLVIGQFNYVALYDPPRVAALEQLIVDARSRSGGTLLPIGAASIRRVLKTLRGGGVVALLPDQVPDEGGVVAPFFNQPALTMTLVQKMSQRAGPRVLIGKAKRVRGGFEILIEPIKGAVDAEDETQAATTLNAAVENLVRDQPEQYQWEYKRFKKTLGYSKNLEEGRRPTGAKTRG